MPVARFVITFAALSVSLCGACAAPRRDGAAAKSYIEKIPGTVVELEFVAIPGGEFDWDKVINPPARGKVKIAPFWIGRVEIPWDVYDLFIYGSDEPDPINRAKFDGVTYPSKPYISMDRSFGHAGYPAISMSYKSAENFCAWLSIKTGKKYRLPAEDEWRYACAAGGASEIPENSKLQKQAWLAESSGGTTHPIATKEANAFGLFDMIGNAGEWARGADDKPVTLGGNYKDSAETLTSVFRTLPSPKWNASDPQRPRSQWWLADGGFVGFRVVREQ